jgi:DnaJ-class molecular chaperone
MKSKNEPETCTLRRLEKIYDPVIFSHEKHTNFADNCATCHHHSPIGQTPACGECHGAPFDPKNLSMPGLKGAYHLQCMGCHQETGSGQLGCTDCHAKKLSQKTAKEEK